MSSKAERLALAAAAAPFVRENAARSAERMIARVDKDGNVVGYSTALEVQRALVTRAACEIDVIEPPPPTHCIVCGLPLRKAKRSYAKPGARPKKSSPPARAHRACSDAAEARIRSMR